MLSILRSVFEFLPARLSPYKKLLNHRLMVRFHLTSYLLWRHYSFYRKGRENLLFAFGFLFYRLIWENLNTAWSLIYL